LIATGGYVFCWNTCLVKLQEIISVFGTAVLYGKSRQRVALTWKLPFTASMFSRFLCLGTRNWFSCRESKHSICLVNVLVPRYEKIAHDLGTMGETFMWHNLLKFHPTCIPTKHVSTGYYQFVEFCTCFFRTK
jgi:hypothetical protein